MGDVLIILWLPLTIAFMAVTFVVTLGAAGSTPAVEPAVLARSSTGGPDDQPR
jgi:hypothetical protein